MSDKEKKGAPCSPNKNPLTFSYLATPPVDPAGYITAFILSLLVSATVSQIYYTIKSSESTRSESLADELLVHTPFSLWHGWSLVLVVLSGFEAFGRSVHSHNGHTGKS